MRKRFQALIFFSGEYIYKDFDEPIKYTKVCDESVGQMVKVAFEDLALFILAMLIMNVLPAYLYFFKNERELVLPFILPFTDPETNLGYYINQTHHVIYGFIGVCGLTGIEFINEILKNAVWVQSVAICYSFDELNEFIEKKAGDDFQLDLRLRDILAKVCDSDRYNREWADLFYYRFFLQPIALIISVGLAVFLFIVVNDD